MSDLPTFVDHVIDKELVEHIVLPELLRSKDAGEEWDAEIELHPHETTDDSVGHKLVSVDATVDYEACGDDGVESAGLGQKTGVEREFEGTGHNERLDRCQLRCSDLEEAATSLLNDVGVPVRLYERDAVGLGTGVCGHALGTVQLQVTLKSTMDLDENLTIGETAHRLGIATSALRFYENRGLIVSSRTVGGQRRYARDVLRRVSFIRAAQQVGLTLREIAEGLNSLPPDRAPTLEEWEVFATAWRPRLDEQIQTLEGIRDRLTSCIGCGCQTLDSCQIFNPDDVAAREGPGARYLGQPPTGRPT